MIYLDDTSGGRRMRRRNRVNYNENYGTNDPFRLVPPQKHTDNYPAPFRVVASSNAMVLDHQPKNLVVNIL
jgi:hypothetical protein